MKIMQSFWSAVQSFKQSLHSRGLKATLRKSVGRILRAMGLVWFRMRRPPPLPVNPRQMRPRKGLVLPDHGHEPLVTIIIPVYNQWSFTWNCLNTLQLACKNHSFEVILADDMSDDETVTAAPLIKNLIIVRGKENVRFVRNCNNAAKRARGQFIFFLNNDTKCAPHAIDALVDRLEKNPKIGVVGSKLLYPDGWLQECGGIVWSDGSAANYGNRKYPDDPGYRHPRQVDYVSGAALMVRRALWNDLGGFDDRYSPAYYEDTDLAMAARQHGYEVWVEPSSMVIHYEGISNGTDVASGLKAYQVRNALLFKEKWNAVLLADHLPPGSQVWHSAERPADRPTMLVIDHYVPTPDQDAGSACTWHYLESMVGLGYRVIFMGESFYRSEPYTTKLERLGVEVLVGAWCEANWRSVLAERAGLISLVLFNRPHITGVFLSEVQRRLPFAKLIYFGHDLHYLRELRAATVLAEPASLGHVDSASAAWSQEAMIYRQVDAALTISVDEAEEIRRSFNFNRIEVFPGYVYPARMEAHVVPSGDPVVLFVGGFSHAPNQDGVDWFIANCWPQVRAALPSAKFWIIGSNIPSHYSKMGNGIVSIGKVSDDELSTRYSQCHVVVVPLRYGAGLKGKVVQALAEGMPIVSTPVGIEGLPEEAKLRIGSCDDPSSMATRICELCSDRALGQRTREEMLALSKKFFSRESSKKFFSQLIQRYVPNFSWLGGISGDGWIANHAKMRMQGGSYRLSVWCPEFHFKSTSDPLVVMVRDQAGSASELLRMSRSGFFEADFTCVEVSEYILELSRTCAPFDVGLGQDRRQLGLRLVRIDKVG